jgi:hypothetical protein
LRRSTAPCATSAIDSDLEPARLDPRHVEQVGDEAREPSRLRFDRGQEFEPFGRAHLVAKLPERGRRAGDRQRRAQIVRQPVEQPVLDRIRPRRENPRLRPGGATQRRRFSANRGFERGDDASNPVETSARRHRVRMRTQEDRLETPLPAPRRPMRLPAASILASRPASAKRRASHSRPFEKKAPKDQRV